MKLDSRLSTYVAVSGVSQHLVRWLEWRERACRSAAGHFKAIPLPYDEVAAQWVAQSWNSTTMCHCNFYHSEKLQLLIMGDVRDGLLNTE